MQKATGLRPRGTRPGPRLRGGSQRCTAGLGAPPKRQEGEEGGAGGGHCPGLGPGRRLPLGRGPQAGPCPSLWGTRRLPVYGQSPPEAASRGSGS